MIVCGDNRELLKQLPDECASLICTDPPYGLGTDGAKGFMGQEWDASVPGPEVWREVMRVLKPGGSCFVFTGARADSVFGNLLSLREAGFPLDRQMLTWAFANANMPKALSLSADADKAAFIAWLREVPEGGTEERQELLGWSSVEVRKAASAAVNGLDSEGCATTGKQLYNLGEQNERPWRNEAGQGSGTSLLSLALSRFGDAPGVRVKVGEVAVPAGPRGRGHFGDGGTFERAEHGNITAPSTPDAQQLDGIKASKCPLKPGTELILWVQKPMVPGPQRVNVLQHGVGGVNVEEGRVPFAGDDDTWDGRALAGAPGGTALRGNVDGSLNNIWTPPREGGRYPANLVVTSRVLGENSKYYDLEAWAAARGLDDTWLRNASDGIVWCAKPSKAEKNAGCEGLPEKQANPNYGKSGYSRPTGQPEREIAPRGNHHSTTKPVLVCAWLIAMACPKGGLVIDPFAGSGTTGVAAKALGMDFWGCDLSEEYCRIAEARIAAVEEPELNLFVEAASG